MHGFEGTILTGGAVFLAMIVMAIITREPKKRPPTTPPLQRQP